MKLEIVVIDGGEKSYYGILADGQSFECNYQCFGEARMAVEAVELFTRHVGFVGLSLTVDKNTDGLPVCRHITRDEWEATKPRTTSFCKGAVLEKGHTRIELVEEICPGVWYHVQAGY